MAQAFSAFAAKGVLNPAHLISKIETNDGHLLVQAKGKGLSVMRAETANAMTAMLQTAVAQGTGKNAAMNRPVAGKSGTTQLPGTKEFDGIGSGSAKDAWFVGYTPELTAAVWVGYDRTDAKHYLTTSGGAVPAVLFREILSRALAKTPVVPFDIPMSVEQPQNAQPYSAESSAKSDKEQQKQAEQGHGHGKGKQK